MPKLLINATLFVLVVAAIWFVQKEKYSDNDIAKSPNDQREYRSITLENDLTVLLISDPETDKAAASMDVNVGSSDDPEAFLGLAHFLEHMLFLGTEKYPNSNEYQKFISDHGGSHNAFTALENTNYFFDITADSYEGALDRFSQQFTAPLFNEEYVEREVNAVHSEFTSKIKDDGRRYFSVLKETLAEGHPYGQFSVGNLKTLRDLENQTLREALLAFYEAHYSANQMKLVLLGKESLDKLEDWATEYFSAIPNRNIETSPIDTPFFDRYVLPSKVSIQSIMDKRSMTVAFPIPSPFPHRHSGPTNYLSNLIGHEGQGSLLSYLKDRQLVNTLGAGAQFDTKEHALLSISMDLTKKGLKNQQLILEALFSYIDLIKREGIKKRYFDEQATMASIRFEFQEKADPIHYVTGLASALQHIPAQEVLVDNYVLNNFDEELYRQYLDYLTPKNMLISISNKDVEGNQSSEWYEASYKTEKLPAKLVKHLSSPIKNSALALPANNIFIPDDTKLVTDAVATKPEKVLSKAGLELWHAADAEFGTPKANLFVSMRSPKTNSSARNSNMTDLMVALIKDELNEYSYPAYLAGLNYELYKHLRGITVKVSGYSDKQSLLIDTLLNRMKEGDFNADRFKIFKERFTRSLQNAKKKKPYEQAIAAGQRIVLSPSWTEEEKLEALKDVTIDDLNQYRKAFFHHLEIVILSTGNINKENSIQIANGVEQTILNGGVRTKVQRAKVMALTGQQDWYKEFDVNHPDTGFIYYLQGSSKSFTERANFMLLAQIISTDYYAQVRTDKQLGYIVFATNYALLEQPALAFIVQSPTATGPQLMSETEAFLEAYKATINELSDDALERYKAGVISRLQENDTNLYKRSNRYWREIDEENTEFNSREKLVNEIQQITKESLAERFTQLVNTQGNGLAIYSVNEASNDDKIEGFEPVEQSEFKPF